MKTFTKSVLKAVCIICLLSIGTVNINKEGITMRQNLLFAQESNSFWSEVSVSYIKSIDSKSVLPLNFRGLKLNLNSFRINAGAAPFERSTAAANFSYIIELPAPDGKLSKFYITEYSMMEQGLAVQFPEIKTYSVKGIDDPYASGKIDFTMTGFHGMVLTPEGDYFIDPVSTDNTEYYVSYYKSDYSVKSKFECLVNEEVNRPEFFQNDFTGQQLRTYRLACAADGEYTVFHGGTVALGQAAIVTAINRVNGVYERDVSVRLVLIANNTNIVYTNPATDPYTNNSPTALITENQNNITSVIGSANYDIGHVFTTGGGGIAGLGVVCVSGSKARGVTGTSSPIGDPFVIDYVAHEMGHQFGGNHTFNSVTGSCSGNRNASTAWEPGSGSTIMPYAGICGADDLQPNSDAYFHSGSVSEITTFTQTGNGNSCPVTTNTGNTPPTVTAPSGGFTIPVNTPFELTGSATDTETPGSLTYCWEEFDTGPSGSPNSPSGNAPIFRSFNPVVSPSRTFPKTSDLLNNTQTLGEILPTYTRSLSFRLTVRDNSAGGGGINFASISFNVNSGAGPFLVTQPNTNVSWNSGIQQTVTWNVANTTASPVSCALVNIKLSTDGGTTFPLTLISGTSNDGSELVTLPAVNSNQARIKVESVGNIFFDISNTNFTITNLNLPSISHTALGDQLITAWPATVTATVTSASPIDSSWVVWYKNSLATTKQFKLINTSGNIYSAAFNSLNSDVITGDNIYYKIYAQNNSAGHERDSTLLLTFKISDGSFSEGFTSATFAPAGWSMEFTGTNYWSRNAASSYGIGSGSAKYDFYNAPSTTGSQSLVTLTFSNSASGDSLKYDYAYAPYTSGRDSLIIETSTNAGTSYTVLQRLKGYTTDTIGVGNSLKTAPAQTGAFTPTSVQWLTKKFALPVGTNKIKFRAVSGYGNNLYLDSIKKSGTASPVPAAITIVQEGYYDAVTNLLNKRDTVKFYLRNISSPYSLIDSGKSVIDSASLTGSVLFANAPTGTYYLVALSRNTIETWSKSGGQSYIRGLVFSYNFTSDAAQAFGSNMKQTDTSPVRYGVYSGDIDQDGTIDATDLSTAENDAASSLTGYVSSDVTGDDYVDAGDLSIVENNASLGVNAITP